MADWVPANAYPTSPFERFLTGVEHGYTVSTDLYKKSIELDNAIEANKAFKAAQDKAAALNRGDATQDPTAMEYNPALTSDGTGAGTGSGSGGGGKASSKMGNVIDYTPGSDTLKTLGINNDLYTQLRRHLIGTESSGNYASPRITTGSANTPHVMGGYQMSDASIASAAGKLGIPVPSDKDFLSNPKLQEQVLEQSLLERHSYLMTHSPQYAQASGADRAAMLSGAHYAGEGGLTKHLENPSAYNPSDKRGGPTLSDRLASARSAMAGAPPPTQTATAPAAAPATQTSALPTTTAAAPRVTDPTDPGYSPPVPDPTSFSYSPPVAAPATQAAGSGGTGRALSPIDLSNPAIGPTRRTTTTRGPSGQQAALAPPPSYIPGGVDPATLAQRPQAPPPPSTLVQLAQQYPQVAALIPARSALFG